MTIEVRRAVCDCFRHPRARRVLIAACWLTITAGFIWGSSAALKGGIIHLETYDYLPYHASHRPLLKLLFNCNVLEQGTYRGRELSYLVDHLDYLFLTACIRVGLAHYLSIVHLVCCICVAWVLRRFCLDDMRLDPYCSWLFVLLFLTTPSALLSGSCWRTAKALTALLSTVLYVMARRLTLGESGGRAAQAGRCVAAFVVALPLALSDEQGAFFATVLCLYLATHWRSGRVACRAVVSGLLAALVCWAAYYFAIGPALVRHFHGCSVSFERLRYGSLLLENPRQFFHLPYLSFIDTWRFASGAFPRSAALFLLGLLCWSFSRSSGSVPSSARDRFLDAVHRHRCSLFAASILVMCLGMELAHPVIFREPVLVYYWLPATALLTLMLARIAGRLIEQRTGMHAHGQHPRLAKPHPGCPQDGHGELPRNAERAPLVE